MRERYATSAGTVSGHTTTQVARATVTTPLALTVNDMFGAMPYENSLVALRMNGPQLKAVLERSDRNYFSYKYAVILVRHGAQPRTVRPSCASCASWYKTCRVFPPTCPSPWLQPPGGRRYNRHASRPR
ncbi:MAG: 5'-nucleotidase C-terminal domain-containing protein [Chloroflexales bacterium]